MTKLVIIIVYNKEKISGEANENFTRFYGFISRTKDAAV